MEENQESDKMLSCQRVWTEIDLDAIEENVYKLKERVSPDTKIMAVIKTDGYGHGSIPIAQCLEPLPFLFGFAVATAEEAYALRRAGVKKPILILSYTFPDSYERLAEEEIRTAIFRKDSIAQLAAAAKKAKKPIKVHIKVDTGMGRIGITPDESGVSFVKQVLSEKWLEVEGIFTHFAKADEEDITFTCQQRETFKKFTGLLEEKFGLTIPIKHCANSAGIIVLQGADMNMVRAGIAMYGLYPSETVNEQRMVLSPAMSWYSHIVYIKTIAKGQSVSYGGIFTAERETRVATIPLGYGDGYPRSLTGKGYVLIRGRRAPVLGRICMDQFMVDVTDIPDVRESDVVTLMGSDGEEKITAERLGELSGRFNYELVCDISKRVPRVYKKEGKIVEIKSYFE